MSGQKHDQPPPTTPNVLLQDAHRQCVYYIPAQELVSFKTGEDALHQLDGSTIIVTIPSENALNDFVPEEFEPFLKPDSCAEYSILLMDRLEKQAYLIGWAELQKYRSAASDKELHESVHISLPVSRELAREWQPFLRLPSPLT